MIYFLVLILILNNIFCDFYKEMIITVFVQFEVIGGTCEDDGVGKK